MNARQIRLGALDDLTNEEVVAYVQGRHEGWEAALDVLVGRLKSLTYHVGQRAPGDSMSVEDGAQEAWMVILARVDSFDPERGISFVGYCRRKAINTVRDSAARYQWGPSVRPTTLKAYTRAVTNTSSLSEAQAYAEERGMASDTFVAIHNAITGLVWTDDDTTVADDYTGTESSRDPVESMMSREWHLDPDVSVWEAAESLSDKQYEAIVLWSQGLSTVEIGERLGISQRAAHYRVEDALCHMRSFYA
jgi:RNA polymerase sigma factor (sigma-70 family)